MTAVKEFLDAVNVRFDKLEGKIDRLDQRLDNVDMTLAKQAFSLGEHIRRTELAEEAIKSLKVELVPLKAHVQAWAGAGKLLAVLVALVGIAAAVSKFFN